MKDLSKSDFPEAFHFETTLLGGLETLELFSKFEKVIIIDAIKTINGKPGDIYFYTPEDFRETLHLSNLHDINFLTALELAKKLAIPVPSEIRIIAIEIIQDLDFGNEFSPPIEAQYPQILETVTDFIRKEF